MNFLYGFCKKKSNWKQKNFFDKIFFFEVCYIKIDKIIYNFLENPKNWRLRCSLNFENNIKKFKGISLQSHENSKKTESLEFSNKISLENSLIKACSKKLLKARLKVFESPFKWNIFKIRNGKLITYSNVRVIFHSKVCSEKSVNFYLITLSKLEIECFSESQNSWIKTSSFIWMFTRKFVAKHYSNFLPKTPSEIWSEHFLKFINKILIKNSLFTGSLT